MINLNKQKNKNSEKGFSMVETLIAITILMISVMAPLVLANNSIFAAVLSQQQIVAFYLTQDAMEYVINKKTSNRLSLGGILDNLGDCRTDIASGNGCFIDTLSENVTVCSVSSCPNAVLHFHQATGAYDYSTMGTYTDSLFKRYVKITPKTLDPVTSAIVDAAIEVTVEWSDIYGQPQEYKLRSNVLNW